MNKSEIINQLNAKYSEIFPKFWQLLMKKLEESNNKEISDIYDYIKSYVNLLFFIIFIIGSVS